MYLTDHPAIVEHNARVMAAWQDGAISARQMVAGIATPYIGTFVLSVDAGPVEAGLVEGFDVMANRVTVYRQGGDVTVSHPGRWHVDLTDGLSCPWSPPLD